MISIAQILPKTLKKLPNAKQIKGQMIIDAWPEAVGFYIASKAKAIMFEDGVLFIWVQDSVWAQHLSLQKREIVKKINRAVRTNILIDIRSQVGGKEPVCQQINKVEVKVNWREQELDVEILKRIEKAFEGTLLPQDLEKNIRDFFISQQKRIQWYKMDGYPLCSICEMPMVTAQVEELCLYCKETKNC